jgi:(E)-4-hydroxy-3-methylbut-2-enyl-diphosphate synthase
MRIAVNAGSLERDLLERYGEPCPEATVESALNHARILEDNDYFEFKISCKASACFSRWPPISNWPRRATTRCISASPR